jgi:ring-1,2-phenylacetyl-CoA epoxidase subunit PaaE
MSSSHPIIHSHEGPQTSEFKQLLHRPSVAWPTYIWFVVTLAAWVTSTYVGIRGDLPVIFCVLINAAAVFAFFTVIHDSVHRAISHNQFFNDLLGSISALFYGPFTLFTLKAFRYIHIQHHLNTNHPADDPDFWCAKGNWFTRGLRWATVDFYYAYYYLKHIKQRPMKEIIGVVVNITFTSTLFIVLVSLGYGWQLVWYWWLPARIALFFLSYCLDYLPHAPHKVLQAEAPYQATSVRVGHEWLLSPLLMGHNYHLVHHLFPLVPFYRYRKLWIQGEAFFLEKAPLIISPLGKPISVTDYQAKRKST